MKKLKSYRILSFIIVLLVIAAEVLSGFQIWNLNMLPEKYFFLLITAFAVLDILIVLLLFTRKSDQKKFGAAGFMGSLLAILVIAGLVILGQVISKVEETVNAVTQEAEVTAVVDVYTLKESPADNIKDVAEASFALTESFDWENTKKAIDALKKELETEILEKKYPNVFAMVDALYNGEVDAMVLNSAYVDILEEMEIYADFSERVKILWSYNVHEVVKEEVKEVTESEVNIEEKTGKEPFVVYLSGSDTRSKVLKTSRSDVNILAVVNPETEQILLINTPRDYYIGNPAGNGALDKLTHCGIYGIDCSMGALAALYDEEIDYYGQINFTGFETMIDVVGGVDVYSEVAFTTAHGKHSIKQGMNHLNGSQALAFSRDRFSLKGGDNARGKNQMKVIEALIDKLSASNIISNYGEIMESLQGMFVTNITVDEISSLVKMQLTDMPSWDVKSYAVTGRGSSERTYSIPGMNAYVMYPNQATVDYATKLIDRMMSGEVLTDEDIQ